MRDYTVMRDVLSRVATSGSPLTFGDFMGIHQRDRVVGELVRLSREGLIGGDVRFDGAGVCEACEVDGLTDEGTAFYRLVENDGVWRIIRDTLRAANVDVSYPLLKEVCEEIVKRYVTSFIPDIG